VRVCCVFLFWIKRRHLAILYTGMTTYYHSCMVTLLSKWEGGRSDDWSTGSNMPIEIRPAKSHAAYFAGRLFARCHSPLLVPPALH